MRSSDRLRSIASERAKIIDGLYGCKQSNVCIHEDLQRQYSNHQIHQEDLSILLWSRKSL